MDAAAERRLEEYMGALGAVVGNDARRRGLSDYVGGLLAEGRKTLEGIAERLDPEHVSRRHPGHPARGGQRHRAAGHPAAHRRGAGGRHARRRAGPRIAPLPVLRDR